GALMAWKFSRSRKAMKSARPLTRRLSLEPLEDRCLLAGTWTPLVNAPPTSVGTMLLLTDGTVMAHGQQVSSDWYKLTPDATGSYVNGTWTTLASMAETRLYFGTQVLPDGRVFLMGGEYSSGGSEVNTGEIYDPQTDTWTAA